jgi:ubiquitin-protein ligase
MASSNRTRRIAKEIADIQNDQLSKIIVEPAGAGDDLTHLRGQFYGPPDTPYEGGTFHVDIKIPSEYPFRPPVMRFETKIWHPNVSSQTVSAFIPLSMLLADSAGRHLPGHALVTMVPRPDHQVRPYLPPVPPQHTRA